MERTRAKGNYPKIEIYKDEPYAESDLALALKGSIKQRRWAELTGGYTYINDKRKRAKWFYISLIAFVVGSVYILNFMSVPGCGHYDILIMVSAFALFFLYLEPRSALNKYYDSHLQAYKLLMREFLDNFPDHEQKIFLNDYDILEYP